MRCGVGAAASLSQRIRTSHCGGLHFHSVLGALHPPLPPARCAGRYASDCGDRKPTSCTTITPRCPATSPSTGLSIHAEGLPSPGPTAHAWASLLMSAMATGTAFAGAGGAGMVAESSPAADHSEECIQKTCSLWVRGSDEKRTVDFELLPLEAKVLDALYHASANAGKGTVVRVAGGWVRDKLLGKCKEPDIDVALDNVTGKEFADAVTDYLRGIGEKTSSIGVIQANPEQSKHLETATTRVYDIWVDFVNLRTEVYDSDSRIPTVLFGTPQQDAERRDFTMNALFYNVTHDCIEDFTGQGYADLQAGVLRTPLSPHITFVDDPLRLMRAVRFASRFGFRMVPELHAASTGALIHSGLAHKVSRERIGHELELMLGGGRPVSSLRVLNAFHLFDVLLPCPDGTLTGQLTVPFCESALAPIPGAPTCTPATLAHMYGMHAGGGSDATAANSAGSAMVAATEPDALAALERLPPWWFHIGLSVVEAVNFLVRLYPTPQALNAASSLPLDVRVGEGGSEAMSDSSTVPSLPDASPTTGVVTLRPDPAVGFLCARDVDTPVEALGEHTWLSSMPPEEKRTLMYASLLLPLTSAAVRVKKGRLEALPFLLITERLKRKHKDAADVQALLHAALTLRQAARSPDRLAVGLCIRNVAKAQWLLAVYLALAVDLMPAVLGRLGTEETVAHVSAVLRMYLGLLQHIREWQFEGCWNAKPLLDGKQIMGVCGVRGPELGMFVDELHKWQLLHPSGSVEDATEHLTSFKATAR